MSSHLSTLLISANVGSLFDDPENLFTPWLDQFFEAIRNRDPDFIALHCQEVGGKNFEESMPNVQAWIQRLLDSEELSAYTKALILMDEDYNTAETFTALGCLYFVHSRISGVEIWNFFTGSFEELTERQVCGGRIEDAPLKEKSKFPLQFFPDGKWSRKGFIRTRWRVQELVVDLVDIHLFHDASNLDCLDKAPSIYSEFRRKALNWTLERFANDSLPEAPVIIFGDFNFRLNLKAYANKTLAGCQRVERPGKNGDLASIDFLQEEKTLLSVGKKLFDRFERHSEFYYNENSWLNEFDLELGFFDDPLFEFSVHFPPTYPFSESSNEGRSFMRSRIPSWCDRVLLTHSARGCIVAEPPPVYGVLGGAVAMGDHKPVFLHLGLRVGGQEPVLARLLELPDYQVRVTESQGGSCASVHVRKGGRDLCVYKQPHRQS